VISGVELEKVQSLISSGKLKGQDKIGVRTGRVIGTSIKKYFDGVGLPSEPPVPMPARPPPREEFDFYF
jgi:hypothetical protein